MKNNLLITVASWEERCLLGITRLMERNEFSNALMFYYKEYESRSRENRKKIESQLKNSGVRCLPVEISFDDQVTTWHSIQSSIDEFQGVNAVTVDVTTAPRDTLWSIFAILQRTGISPSFVYNRPDSYPAWLSRDPGRPRLVYKLSGIATLGRPTCLIITTGFDPERTRQLMWYYEPRKILLGFQEGDQHENEIKNINCHRDSLKEEYREFDVDEFDIDAYSSDHGRSVLAEQVIQRRDEHNIVMASLGPKLGAVGMYQVHTEFPETALAYTPSGDFNEAYSTGISESYEGTLET